MTIENPPAIIQTFELVYFKPHGYLMNHDGCQGRGIIAR